LVEMMVDLTVDLLVASTAVEKDLSRAENLVGNLVCLLVVEMVE